MTDSALKLIDLLQSYPAWVKGLAVLWVIVTGALAGAMVIARPVEGTPSNPTPEPPSKVVVGDEVHGDKVQGDKVGRQVVLPPREAERPVELSSFSIDRTRCSYVVHRYDPTKPCWPSDAKPSRVEYLPGGKIKLYGRVFDSWDEAEEYGNRLRSRYNHYYFSPDSEHTIYFERQDLDRTLNDNPSNFPTFYLSLSNGQAHHVVFHRLEAVVYDVTPLTAIGESHTLEVLADYELALLPRKGVVGVDMMPSLKIEAGDAAAVRLALLPEVSRVGGYRWLMKLRLHHSEGVVETATFLIIM